MKYFPLLYLCIHLLAVPLHAAVVPNSLFGDGAVLQQGIEIPVWGTAADGERVTVEFHGQTMTTVAKDGRWIVRLKAEAAGGPHDLKVSGENTVVSRNVMVGEVWLCSGQSNMEFPMRAFRNLAPEVAKADNPGLRFYASARTAAVFPESDAGGHWVECTPETARDFSATAYFFGRDLQKHAGVTVGLLKSAWGGTTAEAWTSLEGLEADPLLADYVADIRRVIAAYPQTKVRYDRELQDYEQRMKQWTTTPEAKAYKEEQKRWVVEHKKAIDARTTLPKPPVPPQGMPKQPDPPHGRPRCPTVLYNGMIAPLVPYAIKGVIWYQGESNKDKPVEYQTLFPRMIGDWRRRWGQGEFPFLFVQLAPFEDTPSEIREAQLVAWRRTPRTAMVVTTDIGDAVDIHPRQKEPVGARLALAARAIAYGEQIVSSGPLYRSHEVDAGRMILRFEHVGGGLVAKDGPLRGFTIAGSDGNFRTAAAEIAGDAVVVSSPEVPNPTAVRYGWSNVPDVNLVNKEGLPASPFRTDP